MVKKLRPQSLIQEANDFKNVLELIKKSSFDLIILDINMPNGSFQQTFEFIKIKQPDAKILVFSSQEESIYAIRYFKMGADGFLQKMADEDTVRKALEKMFGEGKYVSKGIKETLISSSINPQNKTAPNPLNTLSTREMEIAEKLIRGESLKDISNELNLHSSTASTYKSRIFKKLEVNNIPELIDVFRFYERLMN